MRDKRFQKLEEKSLEEIGWSQECLENQEGSQQKWRQIISTEACFASQESFLWRVKFKKCWKESSLEHFIQERSNLQKLFSKELKISWISSNNKFLIND